MMASLQFASLVLIVLNCSALTSFEFEDVEALPDALSETATPCQDCTQIFTVLDDLLSNADFQKKLIGDFDFLCGLLPGPPSVAKICKEEVEKILPLALTLISDFLKPDEICKLIGLCGSTDEQAELLHHHLKEALQAVRTLEKEHSIGQCTFCKFLIKTLEGMLPRGKTEAFVIKLLQKICGILPAVYHHQCESLIGQFSKTVIEAILHFATPETVCSLIHVCKSQEEPRPDLCSLRTYSCRDVQTAFNCGTVFYCQRVVWAPRSYNAFEKATWENEVWENEV